jgi:hypothetical protein
MEQLSDICPIIPPLCGCKMYSSSLLLTYWQYGRGNRLKWIRSGTFIREVILLGEQKT